MVSDHACHARHVLKGMPMLHGRLLILLWGLGLGLGMEVAGTATQPILQTNHFEVNWPPQDPAETPKSKTKALLMGFIVLHAKNESEFGWTASIRVTLNRPSDEAARESWNSRLAFPEYDWMREVRVWDTERRWLWPNLPYLLRLPGRERIERYGGVDPGKGVDNDFAAVLIRKYDARGQNENEETMKAPMVSAEWYPVGVTASDKQTIVHTAQSDEFTLHVGRPGAERRGQAGIWLIYADFMGAQSPASWPKAPEFAGGILVFFQADWASKAEGGCEIRMRQMAPKRATGFDWERWTARTRASPDARRTARLSDLLSDTLRSQNQSQ
jgi:hypothetical protein